MDRVSLSLVSGVLALLLVRRSKPLHGRCLTVRSAIRRGEVQNFEGVTGPTNAV